MVLVLKILLVALVFVVAHTSSFAGTGADEAFNIYAWQNWSYEWVENDAAHNGAGRDVGRMSINAANIGFIAHTDTGIDGLQVGFRCEQFTFWSRFSNYTGWCNRNSKISLRHEMAGEILFGQWLLPYNEIVAQWIDPFYDASAASHSSLMGNIGTGGVESLFYNGGFNKPEDFTSAFGALAFNRRQEGVVQYVWPNTSVMNSRTRDGLQFRIATTEGSATDDKRRPNVTRDPRIWSTGFAYTHNMANGNQLWSGFVYEKHKDISATAGIGGVQCDGSDNDGWHLAARYSHNWTNGMTSQIGGMYEQLKYKANGCDSAVAWQGVKRDAWLVSGKHTLGNGFDVRFSYMDANEWDCEAGNPACVEQDTDAESYNLGIFYTMPAGTALRLTYSKIENEQNASYNFGTNRASGSSTGGDISMIAIGISHWFN